MKLKFISLRVSARHKTAIVTLQDRNWKLCIFDILSSQIIQELHKVYHMYNFPLYFTALWFLMNMNLVYETAVTVDTLLALYLRISTQYHTSQYQVTEPCFRENGWPSVAIFHIVRNIVHVAKLPLYFRIVRHPHMLLMFEIHFNIVLQSTVVGLEFFDFHLGFILNFLRRSYF
jgi:hypothetical protein